MGPERQVELAHSGALINWSEGQDGVVEGRGCKGCGLPGSAAEALPWGLGLLAGREALQGPH